MITILIFWVIPILCLAFLAKWAYNNYKHSELDRKAEEEKRRKQDAYKRPKK